MGQDLMSPAFELGRSWTGVGEVAATIDLTTALPPARSYRGAEDGQHRARSSEGRERRSPHGTAAIVVALAVAVAALLVASAQGKGFGALLLVAGAWGAAGGLVTRALLSPDRRDPASWTMDPWSWVQRELERSRRYERPFTVMSIPVVADAEPAPGRGGRTAPPAVKRLEPALRRIDLRWMEGTRTVVLMPELGRREATDALDRLRGLGVDGFAFDRAQLASFPADALTLDGLIEVLDGGGSFAPSAAA